MPLKVCQSKCVYYEQDALNRGIGLYILFWGAKKIALFFPRDNDLQHSFLFLMAKYIFGGFSGSFNWINLMKLTVPRKRG